MKDDKWFDLFGWLAVAAIAGVGAIHAGITKGWHSDQLAYGAMAGVLVFGLPLLVLAFLVAWLWPRRR